MLDHMGGEQRAGHRFQRRQQRQRQDAHSEREGDRFQHADAPGGAGAVPQAREATSIEDRRGRKHQRDGEIGLPFGQERAGSDRMASMRRGRRCP